MLDPTVSTMMHISPRNMPTRKRISRALATYVDGTDTMILGSTTIMGMVPTIGAVACGGGTILGATAIMQVGTTRGMTRGIMAGVAGMTLGITAGADIITLGIGAAR